MRSRAWAGVRMQIDLFHLEAAPEALHVHVVDPPPLPVHRVRNAVRKRLAAVPVDHRRQIHGAVRHPDVRNVRRIRLARSVYRHGLEQGLALGYRPRPSACDKKSFSIDNCPIFA